MDVTTFNILVCFLLVLLFSFHIFLYAFLLTKLRSIFIFPSKLLSHKSILESVSCYSNLLLTSETDSSALQPVKCPGHNFIGILLWPSLPTYLTQDEGSTEKRGCIHTICAILLDHKTLGILKYHDQKVLLKANKCYFKLQTA